MRQSKELNQWHFSIPALQYEEEVTTPHTWNVNEKVMNYRGKAQYSTKVNVTKDTEGKRIFLYFGAVYHSAQILVNGVLAGEHKSSGYTPFEVEISKYIEYGKENTISVIADNAPSSEMLPHYLDYDWADDGGMIRKVVLSVCDTDCFDEVRVTYEIEEMKEDVCSGKLHISAGFLDKKDRKIRICLTDAGTGTERLETEALSGENIIIPFEGKKLWSNVTPYLYRVTVTSGHDEFETRIGFRTIETKGNRVLLNGKELYLKACEWMPGSHPDYGMAEPLEHSIKCLQQLKDAGCVFTRFHWQQDDTIFDWCDENGLLVQEEIPYWGYPKKATEKQLKIAMQQADEMIKYHVHHPSIVCYGVGNELDAASVETIRYIDHMYAYIKGKDKSRLVNYVSNTLLLPETEGKDDGTLHGDIAMWNEYLGLWQPCDNIEETIQKADEKCNGIPFLVTEFGLCEPHFKGGDERRTKLLLERVNIYKKMKNMVGYVWFSLNDYRTHCGEYGEGRLKQRIHGSTDLYGNEKPSYAVFREL